MPDLIKARRALLETGETPHPTSVPRRALKDDEEKPWEPTPVLHWEFRPTQPPIRHPKKSRWGSPWTQAILWVEAAVILLLVSVLFGMKVLPWLIDLLSR